MKARRMRLRQLVCKTVAREAATTLSKPAKRRS